jgi:phosphoenolpyruvate synthase/pyruvate phosphate dikinase
MAEKSQYQFLWSDKQTHLTVETNIASFQDFPNEPWNQVKNIIEVSRNNRIFCYHSIEDLKKDKERGKNYLNSKYQKQFIKKVEKNYKEYWKFFKKLDKTYPSRLSDKELFNLIYENKKRWGEIIIFFRATQQEGISHLIKKLEERFTREEISILTLPLKPDLITLEQRDWNKLIKAPFNKKKIIKHIKKYPWTATYQHSMKEILYTFKQKYTLDKENKIKIKETDKNELAKKQAKILKKAPELKSLIDFIQRLVLSRAEIKCCWAGSEYYTLPLFKEISKRKNEDLHILRDYYLTADLKELLFQNKKLSKKEIENRKKCFVGLWKNNKVIFVSGNQAEELAKKELKSLYEIKKSNILKGTVANPGKVIGIARILEANNIKQAMNLRKTFKRGEILITQMTQPNIVDIASKASAIVTDEGGMLSHAATISRELKVPCIVGTQEATRTIRDGDLIEVDANKGIVKILK